MYCKTYKMQCPNVSHETGECLAHTCRFDESDNDVDYYEDDFDEEKPAQPVS